MLTAIETLALSKLKSSAKVRSVVTPGKYKGTVSVTVDYDLTVGEDEAYTPTVKIGQLPGMALALRKAGFMGPEIIKMVTEAASELAEGGGLALNEVCSDIESTIKEIQSGLSSDLPKKVRKGKINGKVSVVSAQ